MECVCVAGTLQVHMMSWCKQSNLDKRSFEKRTWGWGHSFSKHQWGYLQVAFLPERNKQFFHSWENEALQMCDTEETRGCCVNVMCHAEPDDVLWPEIQNRLLLLTVLLCKPHPDDHLMIKASQPTNVFAQKTQADSSAEIPRLLIWLRKQKEKE